MCTLHYLPSVLTHPQHSCNSISMERALKQALHLLNEMCPENEQQEDQLNATLDDLHLMLEGVARGRDIV